MHEPVNNFVHLHVHTDFSLLDGCVRQEVLIKKAKSLGMKALAFTEHGTMRGLYKQHENCSNIKGVKPIYGVEAYVTTNIDDKKERYGHLVLIAKNNVGLKNLYLISSKSWLEGFYYRPRMNVDWIIEHSEGLICLTACVGSYFSNEDTTDLAHRDKLATLKEAFGDDLYLEVMPNRLPDQRRWNQILTKASRTYGIQMVMTNDVHYAGEGDNLYQEALFCVADGKRLADADRRKYDDDQFWFKTWDEMVSSTERFCPYWKSKRIEALLDQSNEIADKCEAVITVDRFAAILPKPELPEGYNSSFKYLVDLCTKGWEWRDIQGRAEKTAKRQGRTVDEVYQQYIDTLSKELKAFSKQNVVDYMLLVREVYQLAEELDILAGPGRGSAAGCLISFLIGITSVDPIRHRLLFERFLSPERIDLPDVDCDFEDRKRDLLIEACEKKWGSDRCARIATVSTLKGKQCLTDVGRILQIPKPHVDAVKSSIVERSSGDERSTQTVEDSFQEFEVCRDFNNKYPDALKFVQHLEGNCRNVGVHAAGIVISPEPLDHLIPMEVRTKGNKKIPVTGLEMWGVQALGLVKIDLLGLKNLAVIKDCLDVIKERHGVDIDLNDIDMDDKITLDRFTQADFAGIFQYDTASAEKVCEDVEFTSFDDVAALVALNRPGTSRSGLSKQYLERKKDPKKIKSLHPIVDEICKDTYGVLIYQEQVTKIFVELAGYAPATADSLRKVIAKKWGDELIGKETEMFVKGAIERGCPEQVARDLMAKITFFGSYGFNMAHSVSYATISYWEMWLKVVYPTEFYWALLANEHESLVISRFIKDARKHDVKIRACDANTSGARWKLVDDELVGALNNIKNVGTAAVQSVESKQPFVDIIDFLKRVNRRRCNRRVFEYLMRGGAFDSFPFSKKAALENLDTVWKAKPDTQEDLIRQTIEVQDDYDEDDWDVIKSQVNPVFLGKHPVEPHLPFLHKLRTDWMDLGAEDLWDGRWGYVFGQIVEIRYNQVGDFHSGDDPSEFDKKKQHWGERYANLNVEDTSGEQRRMKVDVSLFNEYRHIIDQGTGTLVCGVVTLNKRWKSMRMGFLHDMLELKRKMEEGESLDVFARCYSSKGRIFKKRPGAYLVTHVHITWDKNHNEMCRVGLINANGFGEHVIFQSSYGRIKHRLEPGVWLVCRVEKGIVKDPISFTK